MTDSDELFATALAQRVAPGTRPTVLTTFILNDRCCLVVSMLLAPAFSSDALPTLQVLGNRTRFGVGRGVLYLRLEIPEEALLEHCLLENIDALFTTRSHPHPNGAAK